MCDCEKIDLIPLDKVLDTFGDSSGNLIAILQKAQENSTAICPWM